MAADGPQARGSALNRVLGWPLRRMLDPRARWTANLVADHVDERVATLQRALERTEARLEDQGRGLHEKLAALRVEHMLDRGPGTPAALTDELGRFLNWAEGHRGYAAQAELWFNPPVALDYRPGRVEPRQINERIVEQPFVFAALAGLDPPARVLDVGGSESTVALSLAALGHDVTVVDPRGYPLAHPRLRAAACRLDELDGFGGFDGLDGRDGLDGFGERDERDHGPTGFDAAVALSAIEHFGLGGYDSGGAGRLDLAALDDLRRRRLRPGGILALTVPFGEPRVDDFERVYDAAGLSELLAGWRVERARAAWQVDRLTWVAGELDAPLGPRGVALVVARPAADAD